MNIHRFTAATTREALIKVRETLGDDAVILANRDTADGVEILASLEKTLDASLQAFSNAQSAPDSSAVTRPVSPEPTPAPHQNRS